MNIVDLFPIVFVITTFSIIIGHTLLQMIPIWRREEE